MLGGGALTGAWLGLFIGLVLGFFSPSPWSSLIAGLVADERTDAIPALETEMLMDTPQARAALAEQTLRFALALG